MAGTVSYQAPQYGSLAGAIGEKVGSAISMAAGARRRQEEEINALNAKDDKTEEEKQRLKDLLAQKESQEKGFFFKKSLGAEFGGDLRRRSMGFFQRNPPDQNDPALTKQKRFEALLSAQPTGIQRVSQQQPEAPTVRQDGGILGPFATNIVEKISRLSQKVDKLSDVVSGDRTPSIIVKLSENVRGIKTFFSRNNKIEEEQVKIANEQLEEQIKAADDAEAAAIESRGEARDGGPGGVGYDNKREKEGRGGGGILGDILDFFDFPDIDFDRKRRRTRRSRRRGTRRRYARRKLNKFRPRKPNIRMPRGIGRGLRGIKGLGGGILGGIGMDMLFPDPTNQYDQISGPNAYYNDPNYKGPRPPEKLASGGIVTGPPQKLASGGVLDNPTKISGPSAVVPKNKLATEVKKNPENVKKASPFSKVIQLPTMAAGALMLSTVGNIVNNMGGVARLFRPVLQKLFVPAAAAFGLPVNLISAFFGGGPAMAAGFTPAADKLKGKGGNGPNGTGNATSTTGGGAMGMMSPGMVTGGGSIDGYQITSGFGLRSSPGGVGSTNHQGIDYGTPQGTKLATKKSGKVAKVVVPAMGNMGEVHVIHDDGTEARYLHLSKTAVSQGSNVVAGQLLGETGGAPGTPGAGPSTGPHLHFEYYPSASSGPVDGSSVASQVFTVGGQVGAPTPTSTPSPLFATPAGTPPTPSAAAPTGSAAPITLPPIFQTQPTAAANPLAFNAAASPWDVYNRENPYMRHNF